MSLFTLDEIVVQGYISLSIYVLHVRPPLIRLTALYLGHDGTSTLCQILWCLRVHNERSVLHLVVIDGSGHHFIVRVGEVSVQHEASNLCTFLLKLINRPIGAADAPALITKDLTLTGGGQM